MLGGGIALGSKPTFSWGWSWTVDEKLCFRAGNNENSKTEEQDLSFPKHQKLFKMIEYFRSYEW